MTTAKSGQDCGWNRCVTRRRGADTDHLDRASRTMRSERDHRRSDGQRPPRMPRSVWQARRFGGLARSIAERLAGTARAPAQCGPSIGHRAVGCIYLQIAADQERAALDGADGGRDIRLLRGSTWRLVVQSPGRAAADDLGYQRRARAVRGNPGPLPGIEYLRKPAQALGEMPASLRVEIHGDLAAMVRLPGPWSG